MSLGSLAPAKWPPENNDGSSPDNSPRLVVLGGTTRSAAVTASSFMSMVNSVASSLASQAGFEPPSAAPLANLASVMSKLSSSVLVQGPMASPINNQEDIWKPRIDGSGGVLLTGSDGSLVPLVDLLANLNPGHGSNGGQGGRGAEVPPNPAYVSSSVLGMVGGGIAVSGEGEGKEKDLLSLHATPGSRTTMIQPTPTPTFIGPPRESDTRSTVRKSEGTRHLFVPIWTFFTIMAIL